MLALTIVDVVHGTAARHFYASKESTKLSLSEIDYQAFYLLDTDLIALKQGSPQEIFQIVRNKTSQGLLTWVGVYGAMPANLYAVRPRSGNYCAAGAWFLGSGFDSARIVMVLREALAAFCAMIEQDAYPSKWDINKVVLDDLRLKNLGDEDVDRRGIERSPMLGTKSVFIDASKREALTIAEFLDIIQDDDSFDRYRKILISDDREVVESVRDKGRIDLWTAQPSLKKGRTHRPDLVPAQTLIASQGSGSRPSHVGWQTKRDDFDRIDRRLDVVEIQIGKLSKAGGSHFASAADRPKFILVWNVALTLGVMLCCFQVFAPSFTGPLSPAPSLTGAVDGQAPPPLRPSETQGPTEHGIGEPKTADGRLKSDDCSARPECSNAAATLSIAADAQVIDQTASALLNAIQKIQPVLDKFASKQNVKYRDGFARIKGELGIIHDLAIRESAVKDNGARGKP